MEVVCVIEAMKLFNEIESEVEGVIHKYVLKMNNLLNLTNAFPCPESMIIETMESLSST